MKANAGLIMVMTGLIGTIGFAVPKFDVSFTGDPVGAPPVVAPAAAGQISTHPTSVTYVNPFGGRINISNKYYDTKNSYVFGDDNVVVFDVYGAPQTAELWFAGDTADAAVKGSDEFISIQFDMYADSWERYGGNAGYLLADSVGNFIGGIIHNWDNPGSYAGISYYDDEGTGGNHQVPALPPGEPHHIKWIIDLKTWKYLTIIDYANVYGPYGLRPDCNDFSGLVIDSWNGNGIVAYDNIKIDVNVTDCAEAIALGQRIPGDYNKDCKVDISDLQLLVDKWLLCNDPQDASCEPDKTIVYADQMSPGWDADDATRCLQNAINSSADIVIVRNMGADWNIRPLQLQSNQEILFEPGVVVAAKSGEYLSQWDRLISINGKRNITLTGYGATLKMRRDDYLDPPYEPGEQRHALIIGNFSENITVKGFTIKDSGADGILIIDATNVYIKDVVCDNNYRQGMSVISATNLLVEDCIFKNTHGTAPEAGVDLEPDEPAHKFVNVVFRNCQMNNNQGDGIAVYPSTLSSFSDPLDITFESCTINGGAQYGFGLNGVPDNGVGGTVTFKNCTATGTAKAGMHVMNKTASASGAKVIFDNCSVINCGTSSGTHPVGFYKTVSPSYGLTKIGKADFINGCNVTDNVNRAAVAANASAKTAGLKDIHGTITVTNPYGVSMDLGGNLENVDLQVIP